MPWGSVGSGKPGWRPAALGLSTKGWEARVRWPPRPALSGADPALLGGEVRPRCGLTDGASAGRRDSGTAPHPPAPTRGARSGRKEGVGDWLAGSERRRLRGSGVTLGPAPRDLAFPHSGTRADAACPLLPRAVRSVPPASSFLSWGLGVTGWGSGRGSHGGLTLPSSGGELAPQPPPVQSPEHRRLRAAAATAPGSLACERWGREGVPAFQTLRPYASRDPHPVPPAAGKVGGGRGLPGGLPRPLRHPDGVTHPAVTAQGVARGLDL